MPDTRLPSDFRQTVKFTVTTRNSHRVHAFPFERAVGNGRWRRVARVDTAAQGVGQVGDGHARAR